MIGTYLDLEGACKQWLLATSSVASLVTRGDGGVSIYHAMPQAAPVPAITLTRVGGGPRARDDVPTDTGRVSFQCWGEYRSTTVPIAQALVAAIENLAPTGGYSTGSGLLVAGQVVAWIWFPDPASDTPRYIVDALMSAVAV